MLTLYDTLQREKRPFVPLDPGHVRMYVCGPTVYDYVHIGNARPIIVFDVLNRLLRLLARRGVFLDGARRNGAGAGVASATRVTYARNITDVDDKINARARRDHPHLPLNEAIGVVTEATIAQFRRDIAELNCLPPDHEPRATAYISGMIKLIEALVARAHAYEAEGEVLFDVASMPDYGRLSNRALDEQQAGARVEVDAHKRNPGDFVLWKRSSGDEPGWESPWGWGRPGWHIECSAMSEALLGKTFDIHGGGIDLVFPHHENEIAQSCCAHGTSMMANFWMHNGFLQLEGRKMSKSDGNFITIRQVLDDWPGEVARFNMLRTHYRAPIDWTLSGLEESARILEGWHGAMAAAREGEAGLRDDAIATEVVDALCDDLNTSRAIAGLHALAERDDKVALGASLAFMGFDGRSLDASAAATDKKRQALAGQVEPLIEARAQARASKDWARADAVRDELAALGVTVTDAKDPETGAVRTTWALKG
ncbi:MAG: cysteine--tRNA ligase [Pseudomonadota bacterium]